MDPSKIRLHSITVMPEDAIFWSGLDIMNQLRSDVISDFKDAVINVAIRMAVDGWPRDMIPAALEQAIIKYRPTISILAMYRPKGEDRHSLIGLCPEILPVVLLEDMPCLSKGILTPEFGMEVVARTVIGLSLTLREVLSAISAPDYLPEPSGINANIRTGMRIAEQINQGAPDSNGQALMVACGLYLEGLLPKDLGGEPPVVPEVASVSGDEGVAESGND